MDNKKLVFTESVAEDIYELANNLRADDVRECQASGYTSHRALLEAFTYSDICYSAKVNGHTEAMFGVSDYNQPQGYGLVWYLGSDVSFEFPIQLVKKGREYVQEWLKEFNVLYNVVDERNTQHIEWLKHIGFTFSGEVIINGYKFLQFFKVKEVSQPTSKLVSETTN